MKPKMILINSMIMRVEGNFKAWVYDVICEANIIESIHYVTSPENYREILPEIYLSDFRN